MRKKLVAVILTAAAVSFLLGGCGSSDGKESTDQASAGQSSVEEAETEAQAENDGTVYSLKLGSFPGDNLTFMENYAADVEEATDGQVQIEVINFLTLGSTSDAVQMAKDGSLDLLLISGTEYCGYEPCSAVVAIPNVISNIQEAIDLEKALLEEGYFSDWDGEIISVMTTDMQYIALANKKVESVSDFAGLVGRCQNSNGIEVLQNLGSSITTIANNETYMSLETGIIDFSVSSPTNMQASAYGEVCDYILDKPLYADCNCLVMNNSSFASLPEDLQVILKECGEQLTDDYTEWNINAEAEGIQALKDAGVEFIECPQDILDIIDETAEPCMDKFLDTLKQAGIDTDAFKSLVEEKTN